MASVTQGLARGLKSGIVFRQEQQKIDLLKQRRERERIEKTLTNTVNALKEHVQMGPAFAESGVKFEDYSAMGKQLYRNVGRIRQALGQQTPQIPDAAIDSQLRQNYKTPAEMRQAELVAKGEDAGATQTAKNDANLTARQNELQALTDLGVPRDQAITGAFDLSDPQQDRFQGSGTALGPNGERKPSVMREGVWYFSQTGEPVPSVPGWEVVMKGQETGGQGDFSQPSPANVSRQQKAASDSAFLFESLGNVREQVSEGTIGPIAWLKGMSNKTVAAFSDDFFFEDRANFENNINLLRQATMRSISDDDRFTEQDRKYINEIFPEPGFFDSAENARVKIEVIRAFMLRRMTASGEVLDVDITAMAPSLAAREIIDYQKRGLMSFDETRKTLNMFYPNGIPAEDM